MKKLLLSGLLAIGFGMSAMAQVSSYVFTQSVGTFTPISGGTLLGSTTSDDQYFVDPTVPLGGGTNNGVGFPIGFNFVYNGITFDRFGINNNGWIGLGQSTLTPAVNLQASTSAYTGISTASTAPAVNQNHIAGFSRDIQAQAGATLRFQVTGVSPNQVLTIQWAGYRKFGNAGDNYNFQIQLFETSNIVQTVYGTMTNNATAAFGEIGLRGNSNADFNNRTTTTNWASTTAGGVNTATCTLSNTVFPASGTTFTWSVPVPIDMGAIGFSAPPNNLGCIGGNQNVTVIVQNFGTSTLDFSVTPLTVNSSVTGPNPMTFTPVIVSTGTLAPNTTLSVPITTTYNMAAFGTYGFSASTSIAGDGSASNDAFGPYNVVNSAIPVVSYAGPSNICIGGNTQLNSAVPTAPISSYTVSAITYAPLTGASGAVTGFTSNDDGYKNVPLPPGFSFNFYGNFYSSINIETNGYIDLGPATSSFSAQTLPNATTPNNLIALCWNDLNVTGGGSIDTFTVGVAPLRKFVIRYNTVPFYPSTTPGVSGEIILFESSNVIEVHVTQVQGSANNKTLGIENSNGSNGIAAPGRNNNNWSVTTPEAWRFSPVTTGFTYLWTPNGPSSGINTGDEILQNPMVNPTTTTTYTITISNTTGCSTTSTTTVTVNPLPVVALGSNTSICQNSVMMLDAGNPGSTYVWSTTETTQTINVNTAGTYSVTVTNAQGCTGTGSITIGVNPLPVVALGSDQAFCMGNSALLDAGNTGSTYAWSTTATTQTITVNATATYSVIVTDANGCSNSDTVNITVNPLPVVALGADQTVCASTTLDAQNSGSTYMWSTTETTQMITVTSTGTYSVVVSDVNGCSNSDTVDVTVNPLPTVALGVDQTQCGGTVTLDALNPGSSFLWSTSATTQSIIVTTTGTYIVTVTDGNGCSNSDTAMVTINNIPVVNLGADITQCGGTATLDAGNVGSSYFWSTTETTQQITVSSSATYTAQVTDVNGCSNSDTIMVTINAVPLQNLGPDVTQCGGSVTLDAGNTGSTYLWSTTATTQQITVSTSGTYSVTVTTPQGCTVNDTIVVVVNTVPVANAGADTSVCIGNSVVLDAGSGFTTYLWQFNNFTATTQTITVTPGATTTYTLTVTNSAGCSATDAITISVDLPPAPSFTFVVTNGNVVTFTNTSTGTAPLTFLWNFGDGSPTSSLANPVHTYTANGTYNVVLTVTNACGTFSFSLPVTITGVGYEDLSMEGTINMYPNPSSGIVNLSATIDLDQLFVEIYSLDGKMVYSSMDKNIISGFTKNIDLSGLANGMYSVRINTGNATKIGKLIIAK